MSRHFLFSILLTLVIVSVTGCSKADKADGGHNEVNSVYYWKTTFNPDSIEREFLRDNKVGRIYLRFFDVTMGEDPNQDIETAVPNATVRFGNGCFDGLENIEFVPVVYITLDALKDSFNMPEKLASKIMTRIANMCIYNNVPGVKEIQLDCDWTPSTRDRFFEVCKAVRKELDRLDLDWDVSSTIRLHQLNGPVPPVDRGVLMVYNTGNFADYGQDNSILSFADVEPYIRNLGGYDLHLDVALPMYEWQLVFDDKEFVGLARDLPLDDTTAFRQIDTNRYLVLADRETDGMVLKKGMVLRNEQTPSSETLRVKNAIQDELYATDYSIILYHLDSKNINRYTKNEIASIFTPRSN